MNVINTGRAITIVLDGIAEQQVVYNALHDYYRNYGKGTDYTKDGGYNEHHHQLAENMADQYHEEYIKDCSNEIVPEDKMA